jgi:prevent-host-death family protein
MVRLANLANLYWFSFSIGGVTLVERPIPKVISATNASNNFGSVIDEVARGRSYFVITRMGKAKAVVLGVQQYQDLMEELEITLEQADPGVQKALKEAREDYELGRTMSIDELDRELGFPEEEPGS